VRVWEQEYDGYELIGNGGLAREIESVAYEKIMALYTVLLGTKL